ncbi:MAG: nitroreductase/quinone reductase family protein [Chloroflexota bacterium]|nr:nitroreductase/quinone reductase family protein [Chloroflexota bacterium]
MASDTPLAAAVAAAREVELTTFGRTSGRPSRRTIWVTSDAQGRVHIRSGQGPSRDWPQNLFADQRAILHVEGRDIAVRARHVTDRAELLASSYAVRAKYGKELPSSKEGEPPTLPEQATFELVAAHHE